MQNIKVKINLKNILGYYSRNCNTVDIPFKAFSNTRVHNTRDGGCFCASPFTASQSPATSPPRMET